MPHVQTLDFIQSQYINKTSLELNHTDDKTDVNIQGYTVDITLSTVTHSLHHLGTLTGQTDECNNVCLGLWPFNGNGLPGQWK